MIYGLDYLCGAKYPDVILAEHPQGWAAGFFSKLDGIGDALPISQKLIDTGRCPRIRLHLLWKDDHTFGAAEFEQIRREARRVNPFVQRNKGKCEIRISGACEHKLKRADAERLRAIVRAEIPGCLYVNTPWIKGGGETISGINEAHGADATALRGQYDFSFDGNNAVDSDVAAITKRLAGCDTFYIWNSQCNGRKTTQDKTPRPERKAWPTSRYIDSWIALSRLPTGKTSLPAKWIYKSHADQHEVPPEPRAGKPVWICPVKASEIVIRCRNGQVVDRAKYYGPFTGGGWRYYSTAGFGYLTAEKAIRIQGDALCQVVIGGKVVGVIHPAFRAGSFR